MSDLESKVHELNDMILKGQILEAFEKFYSDDVVMQEGAEDPTVGKPACRSKEEAFVNGLEELRAAELRSVAVGDGVTTTEWHFDYTHGDWGEMKYDQVAVQNWKDGKIVKERFYKAA